MPLVNLFLTQVFSSGGIFFQKSGISFLNVRLLLPKFLYIVPCAILCNYLEYKRNCANPLTWHDVFMS